MIHRDQWERHTIVDLGSCRGEKNAPSWRTESTTESVELHQMSQSFDICTVET